MRVFLITGFALDKRAFLRMNLPPEYNLVDLPPTRGRESLRDYALRLGRELGVGKDDVVGGVSLGGMLSLEIAKGLGARGVILIASATHPRFVRKRFLWLAPLARILPEFLIRKIFLLVPFALARQGMLSPPDQALLADIMGHFPPALLKAVPYKVLNWDGCDPTVPMRQLHSSGDWLIRPPEDGKAEIVAGRNHLITVSHPQAVRRFVLEAVEAFSGARHHSSA